MICGIVDMLGHHPMLHHGYPQYQVVIDAWLRGDDIAHHVRALTVQEFINHIHLHPVAAEDDNFAATLEAYNREHGVLDLTTIGPDGNPLLMQLIMRFNIPGGLDRLVNEFLINPQIMVNWLQECTNGENMLEALWKATQQDLNSVTTVCMLYHIRADDIGEHLFEALCAHSPQDIEAIYNMLGVAE
jgi:hypothetical protein